MKTLKVPRITSNTKAEELSQRVNHRLFRKGYTSEEVSKLCTILVVALEELEEMRGELSTG